MTFDLERARGLRDFLQDDCAEVGDVWGEMIAEIERLRAALAESEKIVEHKSKSATHWYDEHLMAQTDLTQSKRVIDQQAARIKSLKKEIRRLKHESKVEQEFTNSYIKRLHDAEARIKELETTYLKAQNSNLLRKQENERLLASLVEHEEHENQTHEVLGSILGTDDTLENVAKRAMARIAELEKWLKEGRAGVIRTESYDHCEGMYRIDLPDAMIRAQQELQSEGKIGNGDHIAETDQMVPCWQITEERKAAIDRGMRFLAWSNANTNDPETELDLVVLRAMLEEAGL